MRLVFCHAHAPRARDGNSMGFCGGAGTTIILLSDWLTVGAALVVLAGL